MNPTPRSRHLTATLQATTFLPPCPIHSHNVIHISIILGEVWFFISPFLDLATRHLVTSLTPSRYLWLEHGTLPIPPLPHISYRCHHRLWPCNHQRSDHTHRSSDPRPHLFARRGLTPLLRLDSSCLDLPHILRPTSPHFHLPMSPYLRTTSTQLSPRSSPL